ncbi:MAG: hypothetical protein HOH66_07350 [Rhodospirillaceae bacterium]|jgi:hypothetical protein|nr:hypothetical protein [Rhodospirillaceae bacterium]
MRIPMVQTRVHLEFTDGTSVDASLYISATGRVQDVLNDDRLFVPLNVQGHVEMINKNQIRRVVPNDG